MREVAAERTTRRDLLLLAAIVAVTQAYQLVVLRHDVSVTGPIIDAFDFHREAARIAEGVAPPHYPNFHPPHFPWLLSVVYRATSIRPENGLFLQALLVLVISWEVYGLARLWLPGRWAVGTGIAAALYGPLLFLSGQLTSAPLDAAAALGALLLACHVAESAPPLSQACLGIAGGLAIAARGTVAPFVLLLILRPLRSARGGRVKRSAAVAGGVVLGMLPVALSNWMRNGELSFTTMNAGINLWLGNNPDIRASTALRPGHAWDYLWAEPARHGALTLPEQTRYFRDKAIEWVLAHPLAAVGAFFVKLADTFNGIEVPRNLDPYGPLAHTPLTNLLLWRLPVLRFPFGLVLPLGVLGAISLRRAREMRLLLAFVLLNAIGISLFFPSGRYRLAIGLALLAPAAFGMKALLERPRPHARSLAVAAGIAVVVNLMPQLTGPELAGELHMQRAEAARAAGRWAEGERELLGIIEKHPDDADAWFLLGEIRDSGGDPKGAEQALTEATRLTSESANAWQHLASIHLAQGRQKEAIAELEAALEIDPAQMFASAQLAEAAFQQGDLARALSAGRLATQVNPDHPRGWLAYGAALRDSGDAAASEPVIRRGLAIQPGRAIGHYQLALTLAALGRNDEAIREAREAIRLSPQHRGARSILSQLGASE